MLVQEFRLNQSEIDVIEELQGLASICVNYLVYTLKVGSYSRECTFRLVIVKGSLSLGYIFETISIYNFERSEAAERVQLSRACRPSPPLSRVGSLLLSF